MVKSNDKVRAVKVARAKAITPMIKAMNSGMAYDLKEAYYKAAEGLTEMRVQLSLLAAQHEPESLARLVTLHDRAGVLARMYELDKLIEGIDAVETMGPVTTELIGALLAEAAFNGSCLGRIL